MLGTLGLVQRRPHLPSTLIKINQIGFGVNGGLKVKVGAEESLHNNQMAIQSKMDDESLNGPLALNSAGGNGGIGTTNPVQALSVAGPGYLLGGLGVGAFADANAGVLRVYANTTVPAIRADQVGSGPAATFIGGNVGIGSATPGYALDVVGDINTSTCVRIGGTQQLGTCASDERFKKNITPITGALAKLRLLSPVQYEFRTDEYPSRNFGHGVEAGLIAQELEQVFPHLVVTDDDGYKRVRYGLDLNMQTIAAVKELALENDRLQGETARLRARADRAEAEVAHLEAEAAELRASSERLKVESAAMRDFLCGQTPSAPMCAR
jgi:hypothetical protein